MPGAGQVSPRAPEVIRRRRSSLDGLERAPTLTVAAKVKAFRHFMDTAHANTWDACPETRRAKVALLVDELTDLVMYGAQMPTEERDHLLLARREWFTLEKALGWHAYVAACHKCAASATNLQGDALHGHVRALCRRIYGMLHWRLRHDTREVMQQELLALEMAPSLGASDTEIHCLLQRMLVTDIHLAK